MKNLTIAILAIIIPFAANASTKGPKACVLIAEQAVRDAYGLPPVEETDDENVGCEYAGIRKTQHGSRWAFSCGIEARGGTGVVEVITDRKCSVEDVVTVYEE